MLSGLATTRLVQTPLLSSPLLPGLPANTDNTNCPGLHQSSVTSRACQTSESLEPEVGTGRQCVLVRCVALLGTGVALTSLTSHLTPQQCCPCRASTVCSLELCTDTGPAHCSLLTAGCTTYRLFLLLRNYQDSAHPPSLPLSLPPSLPHSL